MANSPEQKKLFCFGFGFAAKALAETLLLKNWTVSGTCRATDQKACLTNLPLFSFDGTHTSKEIFESLSQATHLLISIPPQNSGDVV